MARGLRALAVGIVAAVTALAAFASSATADPTTAPADRPAAAAQRPADPPGPVWAPVGDAAIRPGVLTETTGGGLCTSNFVFSSGNRTFLGQAAHCAGTGPDTETDGCTSATRPLGTAVIIRAADGTRRTGTLAYSSWVAMQAGAETDRATCASNDFALVELAPADVADVNPSAPFFGGPTGIDTAGVPAGAEVFSYGGTAPRIGAGVTAPLRPKVGVVAGDTDRFAHEVYAVTPGVPGDSGAAFVDATGRAVGLLSTLTRTADGVSDGLTDLSAALGYATANGGLADLELVLGTEPFTPTPPGIAPTDIAPPAGPPLGG